MLINALNAGYSADYVLMDSWFTQAPLLRSFTGENLNVIGMVKDLKQRYIYAGHKLSLKELYAMIPKNPKAEIKG